MFKYISYLASLFWRDTSPTEYNCDPASYFELKSVKVMPDPLVIGQHMSLTVVFTNNYDVIHEGIQRMKVSLNGVPITVPDEDLCEYNTNLCPIGVGIHALNHTFITPNVPGNVDMKLAWYTTDGKSLLCTHSKFEIVEEPQAKLRIY